MEELGVGPINIYKSKTDHNKAVLKLAEGITGEEVDRNLDSYDEDELYQLLQGNVELGQMTTEDGSVSRPRVDLTVDLMTAINQAIENWSLQDELSRLQQRKDRIWRRQL